MNNTTNRNVVASFSNADMGITVEIEDCADRGFKVLTHDDDADQYVPLIMFYPTLERATVVAKLAAEVKDAS